MSKIKMQSEPNASSEEKSLIMNPIYAMNRAMIPRTVYYPVCIFLRDDNETIVGGIVGDIWGDCFHITHLWVDENLRKQGYGSQLLQASEDEARDKACHTIFLETHSFQAPEFYKRHGFQIIAQIENYPHGHSFYFMKKAL